METTKRLQILNMDWPYFILAFVILNLALFFKFLPGSLAGVLPLLIVYGEAFRFIGDRIPIVKDYLGGGSIVVLFGTSAMVMYGLVPDDFAKTCKDFYDGYVLSILPWRLSLCGSILVWTANCSSGQLSATCPVLSAASLQLSCLVVQQGFSSEIFFLKRLCLFPSPSWEEEHRLVPFRFPRCLVRSCSAM